MAGAFANLLDGCAAADVNNQRVMDVRAKPRDGGEHLTATLDGGRHRKA